MFLSFYRECEAGDGASCISVAGAYEDGTLGVGKDRNTASTYFRKACDHEEIVGCTMYGFRLFQGDGATKDVGLARRFFKKGCDAGDPNACTGLRATDRATVPEPAGAYGFTIGANKDATASNCAKVGGKLFPLPSEVFPVVLACQWRHSDYGLVTGMASFCTDGTSCQVSFVMTWDEHGERPYDQVERSLVATYGAPFVRPRAAAHPLRSALWTWSSGRTLFVTENASSTATVLYGSSKAKAALEEAGLGGGREDF